MADYDSINEYLKHKAHIKEVMEDIMIPLIMSRAENHDKSKTEEPEKSCYDKYIPMLAQTKYGTTEYYEVKQKMLDEGLRHHFSVNRHHPEFHNNDISNMNLIDLVEMFCDHYAASLESSTGYEAGEKMNSDRYGYNGIMYKILMNTYRDIIKPYENHMPFSKEQTTGRKEL